MKYLFLLIILVFPVSSYGTVDLLCVNHITKELQHFDSGHDYIGIGWESLGEGDERLIALESEFLKNGYKYSEFTWRIEFFIGLIVSGFLTISAIIYRRKRRKAKSSD